MRISYPFQRNHEVYLKILVPKWQYEYAKVDEYETQDSCIEKKNSDIALSDRCNSRYPQSL